MACHETHDAHCIGWLMNQVGDGNDIGLRLRLLSCENANDIKLCGKQHGTFGETLPKAAKPVTMAQVRQLMATWGRKGGMAKSPAKAAAAAKNGKLGGRPRKNDVKPQ